VKTLVAAALLALAAGNAAADALSERGRAVYNFRCYFCHGYSGDAKTLASTYMERKPRDFQSARAADFPITRIAVAVRDGVPGTPMKGFRGILTDEDIAAVSAFVRSEFLEKRAPNTRYHTPENGWPDHQRYAAAFPFARGEIALDTDVSRLTESQKRGRALFVTTCITCHDRARVLESGPTWERASR
jgi:cytochrome c oxidase cbb3-type subunit III